MRRAPSSSSVRRPLSCNTLEHLDVLVTGCTSGMSSMTPSDGVRRSSDRLALTGRWANPKMDCVREKAAGVLRSVRREGFDGGDGSVYRSASRGFGTIQGIWEVVVVWTTVGAVYRGLRCAVAVDGGDGMGGRSCGQFGEVRSGPRSAWSRLILSFWGKLRAYGRGRDRGSWPRGGRRYEKEEHA